MPLKLTGSSLTKKKAQSKGVDRKLLKPQTDLLQLRSSKYSSLPKALGADHLKSRPVPKRNMNLDLAEDLDPFRLQQLAAVGN